MGNTWCANDHEERKQTMDEIKALSKSVAALSEKIKTLHHQPHGGDPAKMSVEELLAVDKFASFSESLQSVVNHISIRTGAEPVGSSRYVACKFPGDIDCCETLIFPESDKGRASQMFAERIEEMMHRIQLNQAFFLADFKAGIDLLIQALMKFMVSEDHNVSTQGVPSNWDKQGFLAQLNTGQIDAKICQNLRDLAEPVSATPTTAEEKDAWITLYKQVSKSARLRWKKRGDIARGRMDLPGGRVKELKDALSEGGMVKIDVWAPFIDTDGYFKYTEVTNVFQVAHAKDTKEGIMTQQYEWLTTPACDMTSFDFCDRDVRSYCEPGHVNYVKVLKRLWRKAEILIENPANKDTALYDACVRALIAIYRFYQGPQCSLTQVRDESEVVRQLICKFMHDPNVPTPVRSLAMKTVMDQLCGFKKRIKTALSNEAFPLDILKGAAEVKRELETGESLQVPGFPSDLDDLLDAIWEHESLSQWVASGLVGAMDCTEEFMQLVHTNLQAMENRLTDAINVSTRRWIIAHMDQLTGVFPELQAAIDQVPSAETSAPEEKKQEEKQAEGQ